MKPTPLRQLLRSAIDNRFLLTLASHLSRRVPKIVMYHRFSAVNDQSGKVAVDVFRQQMKLLADSFRVVSLDQFIDQLVRGERVEKNTVLITVDDGYRDFYEIAYPVLQSFNLPATLFVTTNFVDGGFWMWPDILRYVLRVKVGEIVDIPFSDVTRSYDLNRTIDLQRCWRDLTNHCSNLTQQDRQVFIGALLSRLAIVLPDSPTEEYSALSWSQLREMAQHGITIGAHSNTHAKLSAISAQQLADEVIGCRRRMETALSLPINHFCYPVGTPSDYSARVIEEVVAGGYRSACVAFHDGMVGDQFTLRRFGVSQDMKHFRRVVYGLELFSMHAPSDVGE